MSSNDLLNVGLVQNILDFLTRVMDMMLLQRFLYKCAVQLSYNIKH